VVLRDFRITPCSEVCAGWMLSSPLMTDKNTSICYLNRLGTSLRRKKGDWQKGKKRK
jgi:hypothetical protein